MNNDVTHQSDKVQQVHAWFVSFGVSQRQEGRQLEAYCVSCIPSLQRT